MAKFRFPLETALHLRRFEADREQARLEQLRAERDRLLAQSAELQAERDTEDHALAQPRARSATVALVAIDQFHQYVVESQRYLASNGQILEARIAEQTVRLVEARRRVKLLERLREKKLAEWRTAADLELEQLAADSHTARLARQR